MNKCSIKVCTLISCEVVYAFQLNERFYISQYETVSNAIKFYKNNDFRNLDTYGFLLNIDLSYLVLWLSFTSHERLRISVDALKVHLFGVSKVHPAAQAVTSQPILRRIFCIEVQTTPFEICS